MYSLTGSSDNKNQMLVGIICIILGIALGVSINSGSPSASVDDTDEIMIRPLITFTEIEADNLFFAIRGEHFEDVGNIYDRCTRQVFDVGDIEVNRLSYTITISDENAMIYILRINITNPDQFVIIDQIQQYGEVQGEVGITTDYDISIIVFYYGVKLVSIDGFLYYG